VPGRHPGEENQQKRAQTEPGRMMVEVERLVPLLIAQSDAMGLRRIVKRALRSQI
jgi:hypothetical protein